MSNSNSRFKYVQHFAVFEDHDYYNPAVWYCAKSKNKNNKIHVRRVSPERFAVISENGSIQHIKSDESWKHFTICRQPYNRNYREAAPHRIQRELDEKYYKYLNEKKWKYHYAICRSDKHNIQRGDEVFAKIDHENLVLNKGYSFLSIPFSALRYCCWSSSDVLSSRAPDGAIQKKLNFKYHEHRFWSKAHLHNRHKHGFNFSRIYIRRNNGGCWVMFDGKNIKVIDQDEGVCPFTISGKLPEWKDKEINETLNKKGLHKHSSTFDMLDEEVTIYGHRSFSI